MLSLMAVTIGQMRPDDESQVVDLLQQALPQAKELAGLLQDERSLSLVARDSDLDNGVVGAIVCQSCGLSNYWHQLIVAQSHRDSDLPRRLADLALRKLSARGIHTCRLAPPDESFWPALQWQSRSA